MMSTTEQSPVETPHLLTTLQAAAFLGISRASMYRRIAEGSVPTLRIGGTYRFDLYELRAWLYGEPEPEAVAAEGES